MNGCRQNGRSADMAKTARNLIAAMVLCAASAAGFAQAAAEAPCRPSTGPVYLNGRDAAKTSVVVFVHGVLSDAVGAWASDKAHSWPCLLRADPLFRSSNLYLYAYRTEPLGQSPRIEKVAANLLKDLQTDDVLKHAHITIVAHSMGGLVVSRMLLQMRANPVFEATLNRIKLVNFYGTPATGADIANVARKLSASKQFEEMSTREDQQELVKNWAAAPWPFKWYCLAEGAETGFWPFSTLIVSPKSAAAFCRDRPAAFEVLEGFDHISMVKPTSYQSDPYRALVRHYTACVAPGIVEPAMASDAATPNGQLLLRMLAGLRQRLGDDSEVGRLAVQPSVEAALYQASGLWVGEYFLLKDLARPSLVERDYEVRGSGVFANEFVKYFQPRATGLKPTWVSPIGAVEKLVPDGQLTELRRQWLKSGQLLDSDYAIGLDVPGVAGQVVVVAGIQADAAGQPQARMRGFLVVPPEPKSCD